jgi:type I restriction enzyme S subunit
MDRYNSYKDSGVEWMNEIPSNWEKSRIRMVGNLYGGLTGKKGSDFNDEDNLSNKPFVPFTNIFNNTYISKDHFQYVNVEESENQNRVLKNDLFFLMSSESYEDLGKSSILLDDVEELYLNSFCKGFRIKDDRVYPLFLNYQLLGSLHKEMISLEGNGFTRINLRQDRLLDIPVFIPPLSEQQQIVSFLDDKTQKIDSLIQQKEKKIELLKEKRTSLINHVVTKGLDPNVEMKDSGVEWIGEIPVSWSKTKITRYCEVKDGTHDTPKYIDVSEDSIPLVTSNSFVNGNIDFSKSKRIRFQDYLEINKRSDVKLNDVIMSMIGSNIGNRVLVQTENPFSIKNVCLFKTSESKNLISKYLIYLIDSRFLKYQVDFNQKGGGQPFLSLDELRNLLFPFPLLLEQQQIVEYLDKHTEEIDTLIQLEQKKIDILKEYRQSLISEVVTGKIKVV